jgi:DNA-binding CsgD family transcriptional regulator
MTDSFGDFGPLTESFAAAALDPRLWEAAMDETARATGSFGAFLAPIKGRSPSLPTSERLRPTTDFYLSQGWVHRDERYRAVPTMLRQGVATDFDVATAEERARSPYYQEFLRPFNLGWFAVVKVGEGEDVWALSLQRTLGQGAFSRRELTELSGLSRRLAGGAELARAFQAARVDATLEAFEATRSAVAIIDRLGEVLRLSAGAERLIGTDLAVVQRRIVSTSREANAALERALHRLIWLRESEAFEPAVVLPRRDGRPILAYPSRFPRSAVREGFALAQAIVTFVDLEARLPSVAAAAAQAFKLTPAEARLADRLLREESLEAAATALGVAYHTARNVLNSIYQKTETHRQGQLVALLARLPGADSDAV